MLKGEGGGFTCNYRFEKTAFHHFYVEMVIEIRKINLNEGERCINYHY